MGYANEYIKCTFLPMPLPARVQSPKYGDLWEYTPEAPKGVVLCEPVCIQRLQLCVYMCTRVWLDEDASSLKG